MQQWNLSNLHSSLVTQPPTMEEEWKNRVMTTQFPSGSKRGGLGFGGHAKIGVCDQNGNVARSQFCNINIFGSYFTWNVLELKRTISDFNFEIIDIHSGKKVGMGNFFKEQPWYDERLSDGTPITNILQAHMGKEAVSIIGKTRYTGFDKNTACIYCSLQGGKDNPSRTAKQIIEALEIALQYGWKPASLALTTTWINPNNPVEKNG
jgi:hypothetical protein